MMLKIYKKLSVRLGQFSMRSFCDETSSRESSIQKRVREEIDRDKLNLKWRKSFEEAGYIDTKFKYFQNEEQTSDYIIMMQKPFSLKPKDWLDKWDKKKEKEERFMQQFIPERHNILGADLATAHFILYRGGAVKFLNSEMWMRANENREFNLPSAYDGKYKVEGLKCDNMKIYYEGLENIFYLQELRFLSFRNVKTFDDWCLDRVSGSQCIKLEILDISGTNCTVRGFSCLYRLNNLKLLIVDDPSTTLEYKLCCSMLEEALPNLKIIDAASAHAHEEIKLK